MDYENKIVLIDMGNLPQTPTPRLKEFEIWIGHIQPQQGDEGVTNREPILYGKETASCFEIACLIHELKHKAQFLKDQDTKGEYITHQDREWFYNWRENSNLWLGKYYPSKEEALKTFTK